MSTMEIVGQVSEWISEDKPDVLAIDVIGIGSHPSRGLRKGVVVNIESTVSSIKTAVEEAELMAGCGISSVFAGIAGGHIKGLNSHGVIAVKDNADSFTGCLEPDVVSKSCRFKVNSFTRLSPLFCLICTVDAV